MVCRHCGKEVNEGASVCPFCNKELSASVNPESSSVEQASNVSNAETKEVVKVKKANSKRNIAIVMIIMGMLMVATGVVLTFVDDNKSLDSGNNSNNENGTGNENANNNDNTKSNSINTLLSYSGVYSNGNNSLTLYLATADYAYMTTTSDEGVIMISLELDDNGNLVYTDSFSFDDEEIEIKISKVDNGISVVASSSDATSSYNSMSGTYVKKEFEATWSGYYKNGDIDLIIDEYTSDAVQIFIQKDFSSFSLVADGYTDTTIDYSDEFFDDVDEINIEKTDTGLVVTASSSDSESLLNEISGNYTLVK